MNIMSKVIIYSKTFCPFCVNAKNLFKSKGVNFEEIDVEKDPKDYFDLVEKYNYMTVPMIFINNEFIGGFSDLAKLESEGVLDEKLKKN